MDGMVYQRIAAGLCTLRAVVRRSMGSKQDRPADRKGHDWKIIYVHPTMKISDPDCELWRCNRCELETWSPEDTIPEVDSTCNQILMRRVLG